jgi:GGDEF domain-containing protein
MSGEDRGAVEILIREIDRAARLEEGVFGIVLPQKNKRQAEHVAEQFKDKLRAAFQGATPRRRSSSA